MDPKAVAAMEAFIKAMAALDAEYIALMRRLGCRRLKMHRI